LRGQIIDQVKNTILDLVNAPALGSMTILNTVIILVGTITSLLFFTYSVKHSTKDGLTPLGWAAKIGRIFLMISLGANWSGEIVWYLTQLIGRFFFIVNFIKLLMSGG
jgi:hypothetical protein